MGSILKDHLDCMVTHTKIIQTDMWYWIQTHVLLLKWDIRRKKLFKWNRSTYRMFIEEFNCKMLYIIFCKKI